MSDRTQLIELLDAVETFLDRGSSPMLSTEEVPLFQISIRIRQRLETQEQAELKSNCEQTGHNLATHQLSEEPGDAIQICTRCGIEVS